MVQDDGAELAVDAEIFLVEAVEADGVRARAFVGGADAVLENHDDGGVGVARILRPGRFPGAGEHGVAGRAREIGDDVELVDRALDHQGIRHLVSEERAPGHALAHVRLEPAADRVHLAQVAGADDMPERGLVLVEAVAHGHRHLAAGGLDLAGDAQRGRHGVRQGLLAKDVEAVGDGEVDDRLVMARRHDDGAEIGLDLGEGAGGIGEAALRRQPQRRGAAVQGLGIEIHQRDHLDGAVVRIELQEFPAPAHAEDADPDVDHPLTHALPLIPPAPLAPSVRRHRARCRSAPAARRTTIRSAAR